LLRLMSPCLGCAPCIMPTHYCPWWQHEQHVTDGRCDHCGTAVPIVTLTAEELMETKRHITNKPFEIEQIDMKKPEPAWKTVSIGDIQVQ